MLLLCAVLCLILLGQAAVPLPTDTRTFGHAIKNGYLPNNTEVVAFEHSCSSPPCVITQLHIPSIYPPSGQPWDWEHGTVRFYIDGESLSSVVLSLADVAALGPKSASGDGAPADGSPFGSILFGKTARSGGTYFTIRVPFAATVRVTIAAAPGTVGASTYWLIVRGLENSPIVLGDFILPTTARLHVTTNPPRRYPPLSLVQLLSVPLGYDAALVRVSVAAAAPSYTYLEACMRLVPNPDGSGNPIYLSSGGEDFFLSSSYFDEGMFKTPESGLTYFDGRGSLSAYKVHDRDVVLVRNGGGLVWRVGENTEGCGNATFCPSLYCPPSGAAGASAGFTAHEPDSQRGERRKRPYSPRGSVSVDGNDAETASKAEVRYDPAEYSSMVLYYSWPSSTTIRDSCPNGSANACIDSCPTSVWAACVATCARRCA